jgi:hypothetical protein
VVRQRGSRSPRGDRRTHESDQQLQTDPTTRSQNKHVKYYCNGKLNCHQFVVSFTDFTKLKRTAQAKIVKV